MQDLQTLPSLPPLKVLQAMRMRPQQPLPPPPQLQAMLPPCPQRTLPAAQAAHPSRGCTACRLPAAATETALEAVLAPAPGLPLLLGNSPAMPEAMEVPTRPLEPCLTALSLWGS